MLYDKNDRIIASGKSGELFNVLGCYLLELDVIYTIEDWIYVDYKLGGDE